MVNGVFITLDSAPLTVTLNRTYRVRLEAIGTRLRLFVDNQLLAEADDNALTHGQAGVMMYKVRADYDNILVSTNPQTTLASCQFPGDDDSRNTIALRKLVNNAIIELDVAPFTVRASAWYRARFEAVGSQLRVYINDALILEASDTSHATGRHGPVMYRAGAEYDDFLAVQP